MGKRAQIGRVVIDCITLLLAYVPWVCIIFIPDPYHRGFFCDDQSISHPYKPSTISTLVLSVVGIGLPIVVILIIEGTHTASKKRHGTFEPPYSVGNARIPHYVYRCYKTIGIFLFGAAVNLTLTNIGKYSVGRLRPHFFDVCQPDYRLFNCTDGRGFQRYITDDVCTGTDAKKIKEMRLSFPSGHASLSMYCMVLLALYIHARFTWKGSKLLSPLLQMIVVFLAVYTCLSRISDYKHHWSDVLAGAFIGTLVACVTVFHLSHLYKRRRGRHSEDTEDITPLQSTKASSRPISRITYLTDNEIPGVEASITNIGSYSHLSSSNTGGNHSRFGSVNNDSGHALPNGVIHSRNGSTNTQASYSQYGPSYMDGFYDMTVNNNNIGSYSHPRRYFGNQE